MIKLDILGAAKKSACGYSVISCEGNIFLPWELNVRWVGNHYASMDNYGMTDTERKGEWVLGMYEGENEALMSIEEKS